MFRIIITLHRHVRRIIDRVRNVEVTTFESDAIMVLEEKGVDVIELTHLVETVVHHLE